MIQVEFVGPVRRPKGQAIHEVSWSQGSTVGSVLALLGFAAGESRFLLVAVNGEVRSHSTVLTEADRLTVSLPVGGG